MPLTDAQITRYSRQIIVPKMGGRAQERLLGSRLLILGTLEDIAGPLAYMVGAGVGEIDLCGPEAERELKSLRDRMRALNPDSTVTSGALAQIPDLALVLAGSAAIVEFAAAETAWVSPAVVARLDTEKIALLPSPPPCIRCASGDLLAPFTAKSELAGFVAMLASVEALKMLAGYESATPASSIELHNGETVVAPLAAASESCACSRHAAG